MPTVSKVTIENVPPEEFLISKKARTIADSPFVAHRQMLTRSDLVAMGFNKKQVEGLQMDDAELQAIITQDLTDAVSYVDSDLSPTRAKGYPLDLCGRATLEDGTSELPCFRCGLGVHNVHRDLDGLILADGGDSEVSVKGVRFASRHGRSDRIDALR